MATITNQKSKDALFLTDGRVHILGKEHSEGVFVESIIETSHLGSIDAHPIFVVRLTNKVKIMIPYHSVDYWIER